MFIESRMNIAILDCLTSGQNREFNAGFGTSFNLGTSLFGRFLNLVRSNSESISSLSYGLLNAILAKNNYQTTLVTDANRIEFDYYFTAPTFMSLKRELEIFSELRSKSDGRIVVFGPLADHLPELFEGKVDIILQGDIENLFEQTPDLTQLDNGVIKLGRIKDMESLPFPKWDTFKPEKFRHFPILKTTPTFIVEGSRSCAYSCEYCPYIGDGKSYLRRSVTRTLEEIKELKRIYPTASFLFRDPVFGLSKKWLVEFCETIKDEGLQFEWACETRLDLLDEKLLRLMHSCGLGALKFGVESPNTELLDSYNRNSPTHEHLIQILNICRKLKVKTVGFFVIGFPEEKRKDILRTINYSKSLPLSYANFTIFTPLPGTKGFERVKNKINSTWEKFDNYHLTFEHDYLSVTDVKSLQLKAFRTFYLRPQRIINYIKDIVF